MSVVPRGIALREQKPSMRAFQCLEPSSPGAAGRVKALVIASLILWLGTAILTGSLGSDARAQSPGTSSSAAQMSAPEPDIDRPGFDYRNFPTEGGWRDCASQCAAEQPCWSWTFVNPPAARRAGHCWLKSVVADPRRDPCCISGVKELDRAAARGCEALVGRWRWFNGATVDCSADGSCSATNGYSGSWQCLDSEGRFEIRWGRGGQPAQFIDTLTISPEGLQLSGKNQLGGGVGASRMAAAPGLPDGTPEASPSTGSEALQGSAEQQANQAAAVSTDQTGVLEERGPPETFRIMFLAQETRHGEAILRQEHWRYYERREELVFVDGNLVATADLEPLPTGVTLPGHSPAEFRPDMAFAEVPGRAHVPFLDEPVSLDVIRAFLAGLP